jgi:dephospho-CoA kinase
MATDHSTPTTGQPQLSDLKMRLPLIGLTGGIGSGKTAVSDRLAQLGAGVIDTDLIAHQITAPGGCAIAPIQGYFGADFIASNGALDRGKMRSLVFQNLEEKKALEAITHPLIKQETIKQANQLAEAGFPYLVFVVPLLIESGTWIGQIDYLVVVDCPEELQIERVMQRSNLSKAEVEAILKAQATRQERLTVADTVIENQGKQVDLQSAVEQLHQKILRIKKDKLSSS